MTNSTPLVIAIDGPAASGKGTLARKIAEHYGLQYLDTGSIYRAVGWLALQHNISPEDEQNIVRIAENLTEKDLLNPDLYCEGVGKMASIVSAIPQVRETLLTFQQKVAASPNGSVLDGRDIGTVICPHATVKFFITADIEARAKRRYKQLQNNESSVIYHDVLENLQKRDRRDSERTIAPLAKARDAITIDTTHLSVDEVFATMLKSIDAAKAA